MNVSAKNGGGKKIPRANLVGRVVDRLKDIFSRPQPRVWLGYNTEDRTHYDPFTDEWRKLRVGDLVITDRPDDACGRMIAQIVEIEQRIIATPLYQIHNNMPMPYELRFDFLPAELRLIRAPSIPTTGTPAPQPAPTRRRYYKRAFNHEGDTLLTLLRGHVGPFHETRRPLEYLYEECDYDYRQAHPDEVETAVFDFYRHLSQAEQRRILNGWTPYSIRPGGGTISPDYDGMPVRLAIDITSSTDPDSAVHLHGEWIVDDSTSPVDVRVFEFSTKSEVIEALKTKLRFIDENWNDIIRAKPYEWPTEGGAE